MFNVSTQTSWDQYNCWGITAISYPQVSSLHRKWPQNLAWIILSSPLVQQHIQHLTPAQIEDPQSSFCVQLCRGFVGFLHLLQRLTEPSSGTKETPDHWTLETHSLKQNLTVLNHTEVVYKDQTELKTTSSNQFEPIHMWTRLRLLIQIVWIWLKLVPRVNTIIWTFQRMVHVSEQKKQKWKIFEKNLPSGLEVPLTRESAQVLSGSCSQKRVPEGLLKLAATTRRGVPPPRWRFSLFPRWLINLQLRLKFNPWTFAFNSAAERFLIWEQMLSWKSQLLTSCVEQTQVYKERAVWQYV